jgi:hypothetical protein
LGVQLDHVAGLVDISAVFASFQERLAVVVKELHLVTIFDQLSFAPI